MIRWDVRESELEAGVADQRPRNHGNREREGARPYSCLTPVSGMRTCFLRRVRRFTCHVGPVLLHLLQSEHRGRLLSKYLQPRPWAD